MKSERRWLGTCLGLFLLSGCLFYTVGSRSQEDTTVPYNPDGRYWTNAAQVFMACRNGEQVNRAFCAGFIAGVDDTFTLLQSSLKLHCARTEAGIYTYLTAFLAYVDEHPEVLSQAGSRGVALALHERFSCPGGEPAPLPPPPPPRAWPTY